jgi:hypothetical protein
MVFLCVIVLIVVVRSYPTFGKLIILERPELFTNDRIGESACPVAGLLWVASVNRRMFEAEYLQTIQKMAIA